MTTKARNAQTALQQLRQLLPTRPLDFSEGCMRAELQAISLLAMQDVTGPFVPNDVVTSIARIRVEYVGDLPVSGSAYWDGTYWVIAINSSEPLVRQRFSLMHELKHIIDHPTRALVTPSPGVTVGEHHERIADYFAASVLMPRSWVKRAWGSGTQDVATLARRFNVSTKAMTMRLEHLNLAPARQRCPDFQPVAARNPLVRTGAAA